MDQRINEINELARKALDSLWAVSEAIGHRSPQQLNFEMRQTRERLDRIIQISNLGEPAARDRIREVPPRPHRPGCACIECDTGEP